MARGTLQPLSLTVDKTILPGLYPFRPRPSDDWCLSRRSRRRVRAFPRSKAGTVGSQEKVSRLCKNHRSFAIPIKFAAVETSIKRPDGWYIAYGNNYSFATSETAYAKQEDAVDARNAVQRERSVRTRLVDLKIRRLTRVTHVRFGVAGRWVWVSHFARSKLCRPQYKLEKPATSRLKVFTPGQQLDCQQSSRLVTLASFQIARICHVEAAKCRQADPKVMIR